MKQIDDDIWEPLIDKFTFKVLGKLIDKSPDTFRRVWLVTEERVDRQVWEVIDDALRGWR